MNGKLSPKRVGENHCVVTVLRPAGRLRAENQQQPLQAAGWTSDDYQMFRSLWVLYDEQTFNKETLTAFLNENRQRLPSWPARIVSAFRNSIGQNLHYLILVACGAVSHAGIEMGLG